MATLSADSERRYRGRPEQIELPAIVDIIYEGAAVGESGSTGNMRPLVAGDGFRGFALTQIDNTGDGLSVSLATKGVILLTITSVVKGNVGEAVYASDDDTFTLTASTNTHIGRVMKNAGTNLAWVSFDSTRGGMGFVASLVDNSAGSASDTIAVQTNTQALTDSSTGSAATTLVAQVNTQALTDSSTGTPATTLAAMANTNSITDSTGGTPSASALANLADASTWSNDHPTVENNFATIAVEMATQRTYNIANTNAVSSFAVELATQRTLNGVLADVTASLAVELATQRTLNTSLANATASLAAKVEFLLTQLQ